MMQNKIKTYKAKKSEAKGSEKSMLKKMKWNEAKKLKWNKAKGREKLIY